MANKYKLVILENAEAEGARLKELFEKSGKFEVVGSYTDGIKGYESIMATSPDIVICDLILQGIDGFELLEKFERMMTKPKFLIVSSLKEEGFGQKAIDLGASYFLIKPVNNEVLVKRAVEMVESSSLDKNILQKIMHKRSLDERLSNIFITVGIPAHIKGYQFLREAVKMAIEEPEIINSITKQLYPSIADRFATSASKVERAIRHAIEVAWNRGKIENINNVFGIKIYDSNEKPTNGEFIALVADKMLMEGA